MFNSFLFLIKLKIISLLSPNYLLECFHEMPWADFKATNLFLLPTIKNNLFWWHSGPGHSHHLAPALSKLVIFAAFYIKLPLQSLYFMNIKQIESNLEQPALTSARSEGGIKGWFLVSRYPRPGPGYKWKTNLHRTTKKCQGSSLVLCMGRTEHM